MKHLKIKSIYNQNLTHLLFLLIIFYGCRKDTKIDKEPSKRYILIVKGTLLDYYSNSILPNHLIRYGFVNDKTLKEVPTNSNGEYLFSLDITRSDYRYPGPTYFYIVSDYENKSCVKIVAIKGLTVNDTNVVDLILKPNGYLQLHLIDTSNSNLRDIQISMLDTNNHKLGSMNTELNSKDTTLLIKIIPNIKVSGRLNILKNLSFTQKDFSVFVPEKDTTKLLLKY